MGLTARDASRRPRFTHEVTARSNDVGKPTVLGCNGSVHMPRRGSGGPRLTARPVTRVGKHTAPAAWRRVIGPRRAAAGKRIRHAAWSPATTFELFIEQDGPL